MAKIFVSSFVILFCVYLTEQAHFLQQDYIDKINDQATTWKAGVNFDPNTPEEDIVRLLGSTGQQDLNTNASSIQYKSHVNAYNRLKKIPKTFDARKEWPQCRTIGAVRDQGHCGSCWAVSTSSAFADRLCIATDGEFNEHLSVEEVLYCCHSCGYACNGGDTMEAWEYFKNDGLVTGGDYLSYEGCQPYRVPPIDPKRKSSRINLLRRHQCSNFCFGDQELNYRKDHKYVRDAYYLTYGSIQRDIMTYGPIVASFKIYHDFPSYKSGVYVKSEDAVYLGDHSVKLIGWGEEHGVPYWLIVNSWGEDWGDDGLFKIRRGTYECGIENRTTAGVPVTY